MFGPASLLLSRKCCLVCCFCMFLPEIRKARDNKREAGPDMSSSPPPIVAQIFGFFVFFLVFSMVLLCFWEGAFVFFVFFGFPKGFATLVCIVYIKHMVCMVLVYIIYAVHMM